MRVFGFVALTMTLVACGGDGLRPDGAGEVELDDAHRLRISSSAGPGRCDLWTPKHWPELAAEDLPGFCTFTVEVVGAPAAYVLAAGVAPDAPDAWQGAGVSLTWAGPENGPQSNVKLIGLDAAGWVDVALVWGEAGTAGEVAVIAVKARPYKP